MWYVLDKIDMVRKNLNKVVKKDGRLFISQSFPEEYVRGEDFVGQRVISNPFQLKEIFGASFSLEYFCVEWDSNYGGRPLAHILSKKAEKR